MKENKGRIPYVPPTPSADVTLALKCLSKGIANEHQQVVAVKWIVEELCETYGMSYRPDSERDTAFAEGKRFVGMQIVREINLDSKLLRRKDEA
jgi:hypothetical protein